jgi:hypothetical protein
MSHDNAEKKKKEKQNVVAGSAEVTDDSQLDLGFVTKPMALVQPELINSNATAEEYQDVGDDLHSRLSNESSQHSPALLHSGPTWPFTYKGSKQYHPAADPTYQLLWYFDKIHESRQRLFAFDALDTEGQDLRWPPYSCKFKGELAWSREDEAKCKCTNDKPTVRLYLPVSFASVCMLSVPEKTFTKEAWAHLKVFAPQVAGPLALDREILRSLVREFGYEYRGILPPTPLPNSVHFSLGAELDACI